MSEGKKKIVLMYHGIYDAQTDIPQNREVGAELYDVSIDQFKVHMKIVSQHQENEVVITFDDGEKNNYTCAYPVLQELGLKAYFFVIARRVGKEGYMSLEELKELHDSGHQIGSHGLTHEILTRLKDTQVEEEFLASKKYLERNLNIQVDSVSIPRGFCNDDIIQSAYKTGYKEIYISERPKDLTEACISRIAVKSGWNVKRFHYALEGRVPLREQVVNFVINLTKLVFRESGYNFIRGVLIKLFK